MRVRLKRNTSIIIHNIVDTVGLLELGVVLAHTVEVAFRYLLLV